jgi:2-alkenal reductase
MPTAADFAIPGLPSIPGMPDMPEGEMPDLPGMPDGPILQGQGSGWIFDNEGHIVTNNHVVEDAEEVTVIFNDGSWADAEVVATDPQADLAVLKVTPPEGFAWQPLQTAQPDDLRVGHSVVAIGNPFGLASTMTTGIVSALGRSFPVGELGASRYTLPDVIQTDAAINPGNSGGPLVDLNGKVVGVNFAIESNAGTNSGVGFAIPASIVDRVVPAMIADGKFEYPYLGLSGSSVTPQLAKEIGLDNTQQGAYVATIIPNGPADEAGLLGADPDTQKGGDLVVSFNGAEIRSFDDMVAELVTTVNPGDVIKLGVLRNGELIEVEVTAGERPAATVASTESVEGPGADASVNAREAIEIAEKEVDGLLKGDIAEKVATPDERDGVQVWVVELSTADETATVVIDSATGEVLEMSVQ